MTRINLEKPTLLSDQHLLAEYRESPRVVSYVETYGVNPERIPKVYKMGEGHTLFFTNKLEFLLKRYSLIYNELLARGYKPNYTVHSLRERIEPLLDSTPQIHNWEPSLYEIRISKLRINERIMAHPERFTFWKRKKNYDEKW